MQNLFRRYQLIAALLLMSSSLSGCASVRSTSLESPKAKATGMTYFLPTRPIMMTVNRTVVALDAMEQQATARKAEVGKAKGKLDELQQQLNAAEDRLRMANRRSITGSGLTSLVNARDGLKFDFDSQLEISKRLAKEQTSLQEAANAARLNGADCQFSAKLEVMPPMPDYASGYSIVPVHNPFRNNKMDLRITERSLLTTVDTAVPLPANEIMLESVGKIGKDAAGMVTNCAALPEKFQRQFDPANAASVNEINAALENNGLPLKVSVKGLVPIGQTATGPGGDAAGIFYRTASPMEVTLVQMKDGKDIVSERAVGLFPQAGRLAYVPLEASMFVETDNSAIFAHGMLLGWKSERPGEFMAAIEGPAQLFKSVIGIPFSALQPLVTPPVKP